MVSFRTELHARNYAHYKVVTKDSITEIIKELLTNFRISDIKKMVLKPDLTGIKDV